MGPLREFARSARERSIDLIVTPLKAPSLAQALATPGIIAELKPASPTQGELRTIADPEAMARELLAAGAAGVSALTVPEKFGGSPALLAAAVRAGGPVLMKDFVVTERQLMLAQKSGASAVLLILPLLTKEHSEWASPEEAIAAAHARGLEVLLEVYDDEEYLIASLLDADIVGINNRDLRDDALPVDPERAVGVLGRMGPLEVPVIALSGARSAADVRAAVAAGARGVLVGGALMQ
ncbi:MAG TPA: indole-3-glycerol-phosphate synthase TrpC, partial [Candidatus Thermoplasmatota archaeon]|nr:indole-3-glycerol-phosphate synthase TrpC [Candidatus Thermoplasmatota archaeon]